MKSGRLVNLRSLIKITHACKDVCDPNFVVEFYQGSPIHQSLYNTYSDMFSYIFDSGDAVCNSE